MSVFAWIVLASAPAAAAPPDEPSAPLFHVRVHVDTPKPLPLDALAGPDARGEGDAWPPPLPSGPVVLLEPPLHGRLVGEPPAVTYVPAPGFRGTDRVAYRLGDGAPVRLRLTVAPFAPPLGVPSPPFGIQERAGPPTHVVDRNHPAADDERNPFGTEDRPRRTIPESLPAGSVVLLRGGPYGGGRLALEGAGTPERPVFIRGDGPDRRPIFRAARLSLRGSCLVMEHVLLEDTAVRVGGDRVAFRHCEVRGASGANAVTLDGRNGVVYNTLVHRVGDQETPDDRHGLHAAAGAEHVWFLDNHVHRCSGDSIQFAHGAADAPPRFVYVGRNRFHEDAENAVDVKYAEDVVISENLAWGYRPIKRGRVGSDGSAIVLGSDGGPRRVRVVGNVVTRASNGVRNEETSEAWIVGNCFYGLERAGVALEKRASDLVVAANTFHDMSEGIRLYRPGDFRVRVEGNIFSALGSRPLRLDDPGVAGASTLAGNLFWQGGAPLDLRWGDEEATAAPGARVSIGRGNLHADPRFVDPSRGDFRLRVGSPAIDAGGNPDLGVRRDLLGTERPQGPSWDLGALEAVGDR